MGYMRNSISKSSSDGRNLGLASISKYCLWITKQLFLLVHILPLLGKSLPSFLKLLINIDKGKNIEMVFLVNGILPLTSISLSINYIGFIYVYAFGYIRINIFHFSEMPIILELVYSVSGINRRKEYNRQKVQSTST